MARLKLQVPPSFKLGKATLCANCDSITESRGETCPVCGGRGGMVSLARVLNPPPPIRRYTAREIEAIDNLDVVILLGKNG